MPFYLKAGESDDFQMNFGARMSGQSGVDYAWFVPSGLALVSSSTGVSALNARLASGQAGSIYRVSAYIDTSNGRRLYDEFEVHVG